MDVMHFRNDAFNISGDADADQDDTRLQEELKQLIAEQFEDFDLGEDVDVASDGHYDLNGNGADNKKLELNTEEIASINAAGKLSLLEGAIQKFGDEDTQVSECSLTERVHGQASKSPEGLESNPSMQVEFCPVPAFCSVTESNSSNYNECLDTKDHKRLPTPDVHKHIEATKAPTLVKSGGIREPYFVDQTINWELSLPGEVGNALVLALQDDHDTPFDSVRATECCIKETEPDASTSENMGCMRSASPVVASSTLQRMFPALFNESVAVARTCQNVTLAGSSHVVSQRTTSESLSSFNISSVQPSSNAGQPLSERTDHGTCLPHLPFNPEERREILYAARGRQLEQLTTEVERLREEVAKEKRLASHRALLAEGERETLCAKLSASEKLIQSLRNDLREHEDQVNKLRQRLAESETSKNELNTEIISLRSTNESLSTQLVELTTSDALRRVETREGKLTEALERRYASVAEEVKGELTTANRRIAEKDREIADLQRQIVVYKQDLKKAQEDFNNSLRQANQQLEESQQHCQKLASSALCSEVTSLRQKLSAFELSKKISDDVNSILQNELRDLRDQIGIYERMLRLDEIPTGESFPGGWGEFRSSPHGSQLHDMERDEEGNRLPEFGAIHLSEAHGYEEQLSSKPQTHGADFRFSDEHNEMPSGTNRRRAHFGHSDPVPGDMGTQPRTVSPFGASGHGGFHSLARQGVLTSTPAHPAYCVMTRLRTELERCLRSYKSKQEQITRLHETLFTTRCQLHQATEAAQKAEKNAAMLQERVLSMERELASNRELSETPGPRESALSGQLDRLKQDYATLESELQITRSRLQTALGAEARALENEKTASERLAASVAERDAAVDRARAVCEAHYTAMRRRLEVDWANERESIERISEERLSQARQELAECQTKLEHLTKMYKEAQVTAQEAMDNALREAMQERENDRIRFWREELPQQVESARRVWEQEWSELRDSAIRQAVTDCEKRLLASTSNNCLFVSTDVTKPQSKIVRHVGSTTEIVPLSTCASQTETQLLLSLSVKEEYSHSCTDLSVAGMRALSKLLSSRELQSLRIQLLETESMNLATLDRRLHTFLEKQRELNANHSWKLISVSLNNLLDEFHVREIIHPKRHSTTDLLFMKEHYLHEPSTCLVPLSEKSGTSVELPRTHSAEDLCESEYRSSVLATSGSTESCSIRDEVLLHLRKLVRALTRFYCAQSQLSSCKQVKKAEPIDASLYQSTLNKIKKEVLNYVQMCQARAAETLQLELAQVHRRACRQFSSQLRRTLCSPYVPSLQSSLAPDAKACESHPPISHMSDSQVPRNPTKVGPVISTDHPFPCELKPEHEAIRRINDDLRVISSPSIPNLESLLHMIDEVCASIESKFHPNSTISGCQPPSGGGESSDLNDDALPVFGLITNSLFAPSNSTSPIASARQRPQLVDADFSSTGDLRPVGSLEFQSVTTALRKMPSRTHSKLTWIQMQPHRIISSKSRNPSRSSVLESSSAQLPPSPGTFLSCASVPSKQPLNTLPAPVSVSDGSRYERPIPAPRAFKNPRPDSEPTYGAHFSRTSNDRFDLSRPRAVLCTDPGERRVHTELYNLFEQFNTPEK